MRIITPSAGIPYFPMDIIKSALGIFKSNKAVSNFEKKIEDFFEKKHFIATNSGTTAFYTILLVLKKFSSHTKREVILPAYTAPSLLLPIKKAGLVPKLVDVDLKTFNMDTLKILKSVTEKTLAVLIVHMFGIPVNFKHIYSNLQTKHIYIIEDAASSMGSKIYGKHTGTIADIGFFSLNRGKNTSNLTGGLIYIRDKEKLTIAKNIVKDFPVPTPVQKINTFLKICGLSLAVRPLTYTLLIPLISKYKYTTLHKDFEIYQYNSVQSSLGEEIIKRYNSIFQLRKRNGELLYKGLKNNCNLILPDIPQNAEVVFNQFPILIKNKHNKKVIAEELLKAGVESTFLYEQPIHHFYPEVTTEQSGEPYPESVFFAERLLLLPTHPQISTGKITTILDIVNEHA